MKHLPVFVLILTLFASCLKEDTPVQRPEPSDAVTLSVGMGSDYKYQIWFDLGTESIVKTSPKVDWDIAFDSRADQNHLYLNTSKMMLAAKSEQPFEATNSTAGLTFKPDHNTGNPDSLAMANWALGDVYVIDLGTTETGVALGQLKLEITRLEDSTLYFRYAALDGSNEHIGSITQNSLYNHVAYSFATHQSLLAEPPKDQWDLVFTQYTKMFYEPFTPYLVTGVLINPNNVAVALDTVTPFLKITNQDIESYTYSTDMDAIGYDWKYYSLEESLFTVLSENTYLVKDTEGIYYKLHFIDFYDEQGLKGSPKFEMQRL